MTLAVCDILSAERVGVTNGTPLRSKGDVLRRLASLLASAVPGVAAADVERVLSDREKIGSTGVGSGVGIPHGFSDDFPKLVAAVLLCPAPVPFDAIDGEPVTILFSVMGPKRATGEHLQVLARISRLLRDESLRTRLLAAKSGDDAFRMLLTAEGRGSMV